MRGARAATVIGLALTFASAARAAAPTALPGPDTGFLVASLPAAGHVSLGVFAQPPGASVAFAERVGGAVRPLATATVDAHGFAPLVDAVTWRCDRPVRRFVATVAGPGGPPRSAETDIRTPSCGNRVTLLVPRHVGRGRWVGIRVIDRWALGDRRVRLCLRGAGVARRCRVVRLAATARGVVLRVHPPGDGELGVVVSLDAHAVRATVAVGRARPLAIHTGPVLLLTGDSTIEGLDGVLADALGSAARVRAESAPGTRLSGSGEPDWLHRAAGQVRRLHPRVTVLSLGGNEGSPIDTAGGGSIACCGPDWVAGLAQRQRQLMAAYRQGGRGRVVWLLLPVPSQADRAAVVGAANRGVLEAARGLPYVHLLDLGAIFTPDGRFHATIRRGGRLVRVRAPDGLHLSAAGQAIAADAVRALLARLGLLD